MNHDLRTLIQDSVDTIAREHEAVAPPVQQEADELWARVTRRRAVRTGTALLGAAAATAAVVVGLATVLAPPAPTPPALPEPAPVSPAPEPSPEPGPTSAPAPDPAPEPEPTGEAAPERHPALPAAIPLDAETLARTDDSWHFVLYEEEQGVDDPIPTTAFLVDPDGTLHEVPSRLPLHVRDEQGEVQDLLLEWLPGTSLVTRLVWDEDRRSYPLEVADLLTGEVLTAFPDDLRPRFVGDGTTDLLSREEGWVRFTSTGEEIARVARPWALDGSSSGPLDDVSPDRTVAAFSSATAVHLYDARTLSPRDELPLPRVGASWYCWASDWVDDGAVLVGCHDRSGSETADSQVVEWWMVRTDGEPVRLTESGWERVGVSGGLLIERSADDAAPTWRAVAPDGSVRDIPGAASWTHWTIGDRAWLVGDGNGRLVWLTSPPDATTAPTVRSVDPFTGEVAFEIGGTRPTVLVTLVPTAPTGSAAPR